MRNQMNHKEFLALAKYLEAHAEQLRAERPGYAVVAARATEELGFTCTECNMRAAAEACEIAWPVRQTSSGRATHQHVTRILARAILEIADALDIKIDRDVARIANGRRIGDDQVAGSENTP